MFYDKMALLQKTSRKPYKM